MKNLISVQSLQAYAFTYNLRGAYDVLENVIGSVLDSGETDDLYTRAAVEKVDAFQLWFDAHPDVSEQVSSLAFHAIRALSQENMNDCLPFTCFKFKNLIKEISELL